MPLWSNEEWRARIGSCWCSLGRTFNTRFTRCRGKSRRDLSTHQVASMVIMLLLFIAANLALYGTRERHKNLICVVLFGEIITELHLFRFGLLLSLFLPVFKFVVQYILVSGQLPEKLEISLKQLFINLKDSLWFVGSVTSTFIVSPALFLVNLTIGNIGYLLGNITNRLTRVTFLRAQPSVIVMITTVQLFLSVMIACVVIFFLLLSSGDVKHNPGAGLMTEYFIANELRVELETTAIQASLLLRCGDVESNPGPLSREDIERVDCSTNLTEEHLRDILHEIGSIKFKYWHLGLELGLPPGELNSLQMTCNNDTIRALSDMLLVWLKQCHGGTPTWSRLVEAVNSPTGGNDPSLAIKIANKHLVDGGPPIENISHGHQITLPSQGYTHNTLSFAPYSHIQGSFPQLPCTNFIPQPTYAHAQAQQHYFQGHSDQCSSTSVFHSSLRVHNQQQYYQGFELTPQAKRFKHDPSQLFLGPIPLSTRKLQHINRWQKMLAYYYISQEDSESIDAWPPLKMVEFVNLTLVKQDKQDYHLGLRTPQKDVDSVYGEKTNINYEDIFQTVGNKSLVLFEGRPGSGKTTLMVRVSCDWGRGTFLKSKLVLLVRLRHLNTTGEIDLHDLLRVACPAFTPDDVNSLSSYIEETLGENVVFLLDGFDEYAPRSSDENYISKLILKMVYSQSIIILSSRPAAAQRFRQRTTVWVEVVGFMKKQALQSINCYFEDNEEKSSSLIRHLKEHDNIMNLCYLPLHCAMLIFLYKKEASLPKTETEFYQDFTLSLLFRRYIKDTKSKPLLKLKSFDCLSGKEREAFITVCKLAFEATITCQQVLEESEVHSNCFKDSSETLGLVVVDRYFAKSGVDGCYTFLHLTLQEFLAALFVSTLHESEQVSTIATHFAHQHVFVTSRFLFGILDYSKENTKKLFGKMLVATKDHHLHHIQCAYESHSDSACTDVVNFHDKKLKFDSVNNSCDMLYITYVISTGEYDAIELSFSECNFNVNDAVSLLQGVRDRHLTLTIIIGEAAQSILNALRHVTVSGLVKLLVAYNDENLTMRPNCLKHSTYLQKLELQGIDISNSGLKEALKYWPSLVELNLHHCHYHVLPVAEVLGEGLQHTAKSHHTTDQTLEIALEACDFNKEAAHDLLQAFGDRHLSLTITYEYTKMLDAQPLLDALCLVTLPGLIVLDVHVEYHNNDDNVYLTMRPNNLKHSTNLQKLNLFRLDTSNSGLDKALKHWPNLVELNLARCKVDASTAVVLGESLQHTLKLETLDLSHNFVGDDGLHALSLPIKNYCKELKELCLWKTQLTDKSITCLKEWIKVLNNFEKLDLDENNFSEEGVKQIEEAVGDRNTREGVVKLELDISF